MGTAVFAQMAQKVEAPGLQAGRLGAGRGVTRVFPGMTPPLLRTRNNKPGVSNASSSMYFVVDNDRGGDPTWWLHAANHENVAWAGESFASISNADRAAAAFKAGAKSARYEVYQDAGQHWRWRAWRSSDKVAPSGEAFSSRSAAQVAADNVRDNAAMATLPTRTR